MKKHINLKKIRTYSIKDRPCKVDISQFGCPGKRGISFRNFSKSLPDILAAENLKRLVKLVIMAKKKKKPVIMAMGGHVIKCGVSQYIIELMEKKIVSAIAMNGAASIHDFEIAFFGKTSEDVASALKKGNFGFAEETASLMNEAITRGAIEDTGMGEALGRKISGSNAGYKNLSLLYNAYKLKIRATVHVAIGSDIIHQHPSAKGEDIGKTSYKDFLIFTEEVSGLGRGGVFLNIGSAVILPEVFLKAVSISRNLGYCVKNFTTANFDMIQHYRQTENVLKRPLQEAGEGFSFIGHHEILIPLFTQMLLESV